MECKFINPIAESDWNDWILQYRGATIFHTAEWARVLREAYGYHPHYPVLFDTGKTVAGIMPMMEVQSFWTGRRGVCLPFSDECAPLLSDEFSIAHLLEPIRAFGMTNRWDYIELRGGGESVPSAMETDHFAVHHLTIEKDENAQFLKLRDSNRRNVKKALREGVEVLNLQTRDAMDAFYTLHCATRRRHGLPPQPLRFFRLIHKIIVEPGLGFVALARYGGRWIAGAVFLQFGSEAIYKFGASDLEFQHLRANNVLMWKAVCRLQKQGIVALSLGRTDLQDEGLLQFKRGWGAQEIRLSYHHIGLRKQQANSKLRSLSYDSGLTKKVVRHLPLSVLRILGSAVYRHIG